MKLIKDYTGRKVYRAVLRMRDNCGKLKKLEDLKIEFDEVNEINFIKVFKDGRAEIHFLKTDRIEYFNTHAITVEDEIKKLETVDADAYHDCNEYYPDIENIWYFGMAEKEKIKEIIMKKYHEYILEKEKACDVKITYLRNQIRQLQAEEDKLHTMKKFVG